MSSRILVLGATGHFGRRIATRLASVPNVELLVSSRSAERARELADSLSSVTPHVESIALNHQDAAFVSQLTAARPNIVIHAAGPFQGQPHTVMEACINLGCHYIDLADDRRFVCNTAQFDKKALAENVLAVTGASTLPGVSSAVVDAFQGRFDAIDELSISIAPSQRALPGDGTVRAVLNYCGMPVDTVKDGRRHVVYGWQDLRRQHYPGLGDRLSAVCDVPDFELMVRFRPELRTVRFHAALPSRLTHWLLAALAGLRRVRLVPNATVFAKPAIWMNRLLRRFGSDDGAMQVVFKGIDTDTETTRQMTWDLLARSGDGPEIPCTPAIVIAKGLMQGELLERGATPCLGLVSLDDILAELADYDIETSVTWND
ncbi:MAG: saccharopine dehydrogenase NADP-binding domain-containing protein [Pseudomonadota bacterium]